MCVFKRHGVRVHTSVCVCACVPSEEPVSILKNRCSTPGIPEFCPEEFQETNEDRCR